MVVKGKFVPHYQVGSLGGHFVREVAPGPLGREEDDEPTDICPDDSSEDPPR